MPKIKKLDAFYYAHYRGSRGAEQPWTHQDPLSPLGWALLLPGFLHPLRPQVTGRPWQGQAAFGAPPQLWQSGVSPVAWECPLHPHSWQTPCARSASQAGTLPLGWSDLQRWDVASGLHVQALLRVTFRHRAGTVRGCAVTSARVTCRQCVTTGYCMGLCSAGCDVPPM